MSKLTISGNMVYNIRRRECLSLDSKTLSTLFTNLVVREQLRLASRLARLLQVAWQSDLSDPLYTPKNKRLNRSRRSAGYIRAWLLRYTLPKGRSFGLPSALFLYTNHFSKKMG